MSSIKNSELVLETFTTYELKTKLNKYDIFLDELYTDDYSFLRDAVKAAVLYLLDNQFNTQKELALRNFHERPILKSSHGTEQKYLTYFPLMDKKACSLDLATGSGKSFLMFGIAMLMLCEKRVKNVLVLCPSTTIEDELLEKFKNLISKGHLTDLLQQINPDFAPPSIKKANETIGANQICIENIHAAYDTTGSSIIKSFGSQKGQNTLVLNDEAHHVFNEWGDGKLKNWLKFLKDDENAFNYIVNVTGTPYFGSDQGDYFRDVIYRFPIKEAMEHGIIKHVDSRYLDDNQTVTYAREQILAVHEEKRAKYGGYVRPLSIVICDKIETAIDEWQEWVNFIVETEKISIEEARKKVIWVTSGLPSKTDLEKNKKVAAILNNLPESATKWLNQYNETLKTVDEADSPVEWIISVAKLTEGWDVKRVFQIIPHEKRAFNSRLLIAQVLGRGLRVPPSVKAAFPKEEITVTVNNHPSWYAEIKDLFNEILEIKERGSWGYDSKKGYDITLYNLEYKEEISGEQTTGAPTEFKGKFHFYSQKMEHEATASFKNVKDEWKTKQMSYKYQETGTRDIDTAARELYAYVQTHDDTPDKTITKRFTPKQLIELITTDLEDNKFDSSFLSKQNFTQAQYALAPLFRKAGETAAIYQSKSEHHYPLSMEAFSKQSFSESGLMKEGYFYYDEKTLNWYEREDEKIWVEKNTNIDASIAQIIADMGKTTKIEEIQKLSTEMVTLNLMKQRFIKVPNEKFKTPLNAVYVSYKPEQTFMESLIVHSDKIDWFIKSPDKGFYSLPYQHEAKGTTHSKTHHFNPDFFLKVKGQDDIVVVEIKKKDDLDSKNKAKQRDAQSHFKDLNERLSEAGINQRYYFKFLSDDGNDIGAFFQSIKSGEYGTWESKLMRDLAG